MGIEKFILKFVNFFDLDKKIIQRNGDKYLTRYYVFRKPLKWMPSIYIHCFHRGDEDISNSGNYVLHQHPWALSFSFILSGSYIEERLVSAKIKTRIFNPGNINIIAANDFHRVDTLTSKVWTLFVSGSKTQDWGFLDPITNEYTQWEEFIRNKEMAAHDF
jgi:hypothetical protein